MVEPLGSHSWSSNVRSSRWFVLVACCVATFSDVYLYGVLAPILPFVLPSQAHVPQQDGMVQTWVSVLPALLAAAIVIASPFAGWTSDRCKHRQPLFFAALFTQAAAIGLFAAGTSLALWIAGTVLAGISSAVVWASCLSIIVERVDQTELAQFLGYSALSASMGVLLGPLFGGIAYEYGGAYAVWSMCFGLVGLDAVLRLLLIEPRNARSSSKTEATASHAPEEEPTSSLAALQLLKSPRMLNALWATIAKSTILTAFDAALAIFARDTFQWDSLAAGLLFVPLVIPSLLSPYVGLVTDRHGGRLIATAGFLGAVIVLTCLRFVDHNSISQKIVLCALLFLVALFLRTTVGLFSAEVAHVVLAYEEKHPGVFGKSGALAQAESVWWGAFSVGAACGPLWGGLIQGVAGWKTMTWTLALLSGVTALPVLLHTDSPLLQRQPTAKG